VHEKALELRFVDVQLHDDVVGRRRGGGNVRPEVVRAAGVARERRVKVLELWL